jgi:putative addiction module component (TIGR02574 family)
LCRELRTVTSNLQTVVAAALALPESERLLLVERVLESLPDERDEIADADLVAELDRRRAELETGSDKGISWAELRKRK